MNDELTMMQRVKALYKSPFKKSAISPRMIFDKENNLVAEFEDDGSGEYVFSPRGSGRLLYVPDGDSLFDALELYLLEIIDGEQDVDECIRILNEAWS